MASTIDPICSEYPSSSWIRAATPFVLVLIASMPRPLFSIETVPKEAAFLAFPVAEDTSCESVATCRIDLVSSSTEVETLAIDVACSWAPRAISSLAVINRSTVSAVCCTVEDCS